MKNYIFNKLKECTRCHKVMDKSFFYKRRDKPIGVISRCKACIKIIERIY